MYGHNVMPSTYGYQSVGYTEQYPAPAIANLKMEEAILIVSEEGTRTYIGVDYSGTGKLYALRTTGEWILPAGSPSITAVNRVSSATINGLTYVAAAGLGVWKYSIATESFTKVTLKGLQDSGIKGILQSTGYLIVWSDTGVVWSATDDPLDFEPSEISGASAGEIQEAKGKITFCQQTSYGFIVYTENNAISVTWSGNTEYPFNFKSIAGAGGVAGSEMVTVETVNAQYAYTTNGMQQVYHTGAKTVLAYLTDFIAGQVFEDFDEATDTFTVTSFSHTMKKKLTLVNDRYLVLSYGVEQSEPFTHAIVIDVVQTRTGKLKLSHTSVFELRNISPEVIETPRESIAFLQSDGSVKVADLSLRSPNSSGVLVLGRYRLMRAAKTIFHKIRLENIHESAVVEVKLYPMIGTKLLNNPVSLMQDPNIPQESRMRDYLGEHTGDTHAVLIKGRFNIMTVLLSLLPGGEY